LLAASDVPPSATKSAMSEMTNAGLGALKRRLSTEWLTDGGATLAPARSQIKAPDEGFETSRDVLVRVAG
jgi:hypothetical protein